MAFVQEKIPDEYIETIEDYTAKRCAEGDFWQIDREREIMFYQSGGNPRGTEKSYHFVWHGKILNVGSNYCPKDNKITEWRDTYIDIPEDLENQRMEIIAALKEAFAATNIRETIKVIFDKRMKIVEGV